VTLFLPCPPASGLSWEAALGTSITRWEGTAVVRRDFPCDIKALCPLSSVENTMHCEFAYLRDLLIR
jgi:hypothetical protein